MALFLSVDHVTALRNTGGMYRFPNSARVLRGHVTIPRTQGRHFVFFFFCGGG